MKNCAFSLLHPLFLLFNQSINSGTFPSLWKTSYITPIFKSGDRKDVSNYRPISLISFIPKLLDSIMANKLSEVVYGKIISEQHGFLKWRPVLTNLLLFSNEVSTLVNDKAQVDTIYLDFSKAFDKVSHHKPLLKLKSFGVGGAILAWFHSYLINRRQIVKVKGFSSTPIEVH